MKWRDCLPKPVTSERLDPSREQLRAMERENKRYPVDRLAVYATGPFRNVPATPESIDSTARHEMLHVLLAELVHVVAQTEDGDLQMAAEHRVVNTLEKLLA